MTVRCTYESERGISRLKRIIDALKEAPMTAGQLSEKLFMSQTTAHEAMRHLHGVKKSVHIKGWEITDFHKKPIFAAGSGTDEPKPKKLERPEARRRQLQRLKADPERYELHMARRKAREWKPRADPFLLQFAGLFKNSNQGAAHQ